MKKYLLLFFIFHSSFSFCQSWLWAKQGRNNTWTNDAYGIAIDNFHNAYLTGRYNDDTLILNSDTLFSTIGKADQPFLVKYNENGNLLWAFTSQTSKNGAGFSNGVATDRQNNVYITGLFDDTIYFQSFSLENNGAGLNSYNVFLVKFNENGNVLWAKQSKSDDIRGVNNTGKSLITDKTGNIYVTGFFEDTIYFDSDTLKSTFSTSAFLVKYSPAGNVIWAKQPIGGKQSSSAVYGNHPIACDDSGYIYIAGYFTDTVYFGAQRLTSLYEDAFVAKYDSNGNAIWARQSTHTSPGYNEYASAYGVCTDNKGNVYVDGNFYDTVYFGPTRLISPYYAQNMYWAKYDKNGNILWVKQSYQFDTINWNVWNISSDASANLYIAASDGQRGAFEYLKTKVIIDSDTLTINKRKSPFIFIKFDSSGTVLNSYVLYGNDITPLAVDSSGCYVYLGGCADSSMVFGSDTIGPHINPLNGLIWPFIARWSDGGCTTGITPIKTQDLVINLYPNPTNQKLNISFNGQTTGLATLSIMDITGREVLSCMKNINNDITQVDVSSLASGMYFIQIKIKNTYVTQKFIKL